MTQTFESVKQFPWHEAPNLLLPALIFAAVNFSATVAVCGAFEAEHGTSQSAPLLDSRLLSSAAHAW